MINGLKNDEITKLVGGRFRLTALIQRRWAQLLEGARPMVERGQMSDLELIVEEIRQGKIVVDDEPAAMTDDEAARAGSETL
ncbi:MAG: DNA-directed RNA polymerase subunit omega [Planctomycetes bacterium]|nr:DNA-directed RNA polymerase subunit omega [Planctomycetota bacterium]NOG53668.1 DNA-directed RNA polymerase subunit omega [Planctomycetota bacterium]